MATLGPNVEPQDVFKPEHIQSGIQKIQRDLETLEAEGKEFPRTRKILEDFLALREEEKIRGKVGPRLFVQIIQAYYGEVVFPRMGRENKVKETSTKQVHPLLYGMIIVGVVMVWLLLN